MKDRKRKRVLFLQVPCLWLCPLLFQWLLWEPLVALSRTQLTNLHLPFQRLSLQKELLIYHRHRSREPKHRIWTFPHHLIPQRRYIYLPMTWKIRREIIRAITLMVARIVDADLHGRFATIRLTWAFLHKASNFLRILSFPSIVLTRDSGMSLIAWCEFQPNPDFFCSSVGAALENNRLLLKLSFTDLRHLFGEKERWLGSFKPFVLLK